MNHSPQEVSQQVAAHLLKVEAVRLSPDKPFTWASGWLSPIYCDNRRTLSFPDSRSYIKNALAALVRRLYPQAEYIAGVATGAISWGMLVADVLELPFVYVRPKPKDHGMGNQIEGFLPKGKKVVVVEDLISTGGSSLKAVKAIRQQAEVEVLGLVAVYTHGFAVAEELFAQAGVPMHTLSHYDAVLQQALAIDYISQATAQLLQEWRKDPANWKPC